MSSFFTLPGSAAAKKRKRTVSGAGGEGAGKKARGTGEQRKTRRREEDEISSESEDEERPLRDEDEEDEEEEFANETAAERRLRLAQQYLDNIREEVDEGGFDAEEIDRDLIAERLQGDVAELKGRLYRHIASDYSYSTAISTLFRSDNTTTTAIAACTPHIYTVTRDRYLNKWLLPTPPTSHQSNLTPSRKPKRIRYARGSRKHDTNFAGHIDDILCVAASDSGKFVATGGKDNRLVVWDAEELKVLKVFHQHRSPVTGLVFRRGTNQLYSCSADRTVKLWSLDELAYVETLFGHQDEVVGISALAAERCVTVGARDRTARLWKIVDETQLVFRGSQPGEKARKNKDGTERYEEGSIDCVAMIDDEHFVTGSDNGTISLWSVHKKKPVHTITLAHGLNPPPPPHLSSAELEPPSEPPCPPQPRYITALATIPYSDLILSGSWDGSVRAWKITKDKKHLESLGTVGEEGKIRGVVNGIAVIERGGKVKGDDGKTTGKKGEEEIVVVVGVGEELRMGRWLKIKSRNGGYILKVRRSELETDEVMEDA